MTQGNSPGSQLAAELIRKYPVILPQNLQFLQTEVAIVQRTMPDPATSSQQERRDWSISLSTLSFSAKAAAADKIGFLFETIEGNWLR